MKQQDFHDIKNDFKKCAYHAVQVFFFIIEYI